MSFSIIQQITVDYGCIFGSPLSKKQSGHRRRKQFILLAIDVSHYQARYVSTIIGLLVDRRRRNVSKSRPIRGNVPRNVAFLWRMTASCSNYITTIYFFENSSTWTTLFSVNIEIGYFIWFIIPFSSLRRGEKLYDFL